MTGSHWWTIATNWWTIFKPIFDKWYGDNIALIQSTPSTFSKLLGTANIHASHCGTLTGKFRLLPGGLLDLPYETDLLGETQIVDNEGQIIARLAKEDGPGVLIAEIDLTAKKPSMVLPDRFWIPELSQPFKQFWAHQNAVGKPLYNQAKKSGKLKTGQNPA